MNQRREEFLNLKTPPARLNAEEAAWYLGFAAHDIPVLVTKGLLKPLGHPTDGTIKLFAFVTLERLRSDPKWLARATDTMIEYWREKNARKRSNGGRLLSRADNPNGLAELAQHEGKGHEN